MNFNEILLTNAFIISFIVFIIYYLFIKIRERLPKRELCWFCHKSNKIMFSEMNSWNCIHCNQYNGFTQDGNYNKLISAQFDSTKNINKYCRQLPQCYSNSNKLCNECNVNQEIKVKLLAEFIPFNETNFSQECDEYKKHLEKEYKLCAICEKKLENILCQPINTLKEFIKTPAKRFNENDSVFVKQKTKQTTNWFHFITINLLENGSLFCASVLLMFGIKELQETTELSFIEFPQKLTQFLSIYYSNSSSFIVIGFLISFISVIICGKDSLYITNVFSQLLWIIFLFINIPQLKESIHKRDSILLRPILCVFLIILSAINTCIRLLVVKRKTSTESNPLIAHKKASETVSHNTNVCSNKAIEKQNCKENNSIKSNGSADQGIREQIKALCLLDDSDLKRIRDIPNERHSNSSSIKSSFIYDNSLSNNIILPAKFNYESIAQTSWVSPFKPFPTQSISPRKQNLNSTLFTNCNRMTSSSHWINHNMTGLVTPPPSVPESISSELAFVNRYPLVNTTMKTSSPNILDYQRNSFYNYNESFLRNRFIGENSIGQNRTDSIGQNRTDSIGLSSKESSVCGSLSTLTITKTSNKCLTQKIVNQSLSTNLTQTFVFAVFLLLLFCFVIFLSLPVVFKTSCDFNSFSFQFTVESVPQNNYCLK